MPRMPRLPGVRYPPPLPPPIYGDIPEDVGVPEPSYDVAQAYEDQLRTGPPPVPGWRKFLAAGIGALGGVTQGTPGAVNPALTQAAQQNITGEGGWRSGLDLLGKAAEEERRRNEGILRSKQAEESLAATKEYRQQMAEDRKAAQENRNAQTEQRGQEDYQRGLENVTSKLYGRPLQSYDLSVPGARRVTTDVPTPEGDAMMELPEPITGTAGPAQTSQMQAPLTEGYSAYTLPGTKKSPAIPFEIPTGPAAERQRALARGTMQTTAEGETPTSTVNARIGAESRSDAQKARDEEAWSRLQANLDAQWKRLQARLAATAGKEGKANQAILTRYAAMKDRILAGTQQQFRAGQSRFDADWKGIDAAVTRGQLKGDAEKQQRDALTARWENEKRQIEEAAATRLDDLEANLPPAALPQGRSEKPPRTPPTAGDRVKVKAPNGTVGTLPRAQLQQAIAQGYVEVP